MECFFLLMRVGTRFGIKNLTFNQLIVPLQLKL